ncbi:MAG: FG-GAP repeat protein [Armatimonadetes bacterium]|nr:FG-GAP repeat protein [Armatimonadota bacterium]
MTIALTPLAIGAHAQTTLYMFNGDSAGDFFGRSVSGAGDVNADGYADLIVGAQFDDNNGASSGSARVFSGKDGSVLFTFSGDSSGDFFGFAVSGAGDVNNDGHDDVIVGAFGDDNNGSFSGSARVFSGKTGAALYTFDGDSALEFFGSSVSGAGDVNNDGYADLIVGAQGDDNNGTFSGSARVFSGKDGALLYIFNGDSASDFFGVSVSGVGDVNHDGFDDVIVGAHFDDNSGTDSGSARVLSGKDGSVLFSFDGDAAGDNFGRSVSGAGDVNNDGFPDMVVGAFTADGNGTDSGSARVFSGKDGTVLYTFDGDSPDDQFGVSVSGAGDVDGDGFDDLIVGSLNDDNNGSNSGSARVFSGADGSVLYTLDGDSAGDRFGRSVSGAGDVDADGFADIIVGAQTDDNNGTDSGSASIISGRPTSTTRIENLLEDVVLLNLNTGIENSLDAKLDAVLIALDDANANNDQAAINALQAFINSVEAQSGTKITAEDADALIAAAQAIIDLLTEA